MGGEKSEDAYLLHYSKNRFISKNMSRLHMLMTLNRHPQLWSLAWAFQRFTGLIITLNPELQTRNQWYSPQNGPLFPRIHFLMVIPLFFQVSLLNTLDPSFKTFVVCFTFLFPTIQSLELCFRPPGTCLFCMFMYILCVIQVPISGPWLCSFLLWGVYFISSHPSKSYQVNDLRSISI